MRCTDLPTRAASGLLPAALALLLGGCAMPRLELPEILRPAPERPAPVESRAPAPEVPGTTAPAAPGATAPTTAMPSFRRARDWDELRLQVAHRLVAANPGLTYDGPVPEPLLAIPVLEVELNRDGSIREIVVQRMPRQAQDTVQIAIGAMRRAAPFGDVSHLPRPWKFSEVFLFNDDRRFKPRLLDQ